MLFLGNSLIKKEYSILLTILTVLIFGAPYFLARQIPELGKLSAYGFGFIKMLDTLLM